LELTLTFEMGSMSGSRINIEDETVLGRRGDLIIEDPEVSRRHAVIRRSGDGFEIEDLSSRNGTLVDDTWIDKPTALHEGSVIRLGSTLIRVHLQAIERPDDSRPAPYRTPGPPLGASDPLPAAVPTSEPPPRPELEREPSAKPVVSTLPQRLGVGGGPVVGDGSELVGASLGPYQLDRILRRDEMFTIFRGYQASLDRYVTVKVLVSPRDQDFVERFKLEARILGRLQHPNIVPIYDQGIHEGHLYLVTQYLDNDVTLAELVGEPMDPVRALRLIAQVLSALQHAHSIQVIHRNVKPANVMMPLPSWPMLSGFDIAKLVTEGNQPGLTRHGLILGTAAYIAPEQAFGLRVDGRADVYSAGIVLYELLTGRVPFLADSPQAMLTKQAYEPPPSPRSIHPDLPPAVEPPLMKALAKDASKRYQTAGEMARVLEGTAALLERSKRSDPATDLYKEGVEAFDQGRWGEAVDRLSRLAELDPGDDDVLSLLQAAQDAGGASADLK
jgi:serine/threonine protein kinase